MDNAPSTPASPSSGPEPAHEPAHEPAAEPATAAAPASSQAGAVTPTIRLHPADDVVIARSQLISGTRIEEEGVTVAGLIPAGVPEA